MTGLRSTPQPEPSSLTASLGGFRAWAKAEDTPGVLGRSDWMMGRSEAKLIVEALEAAESVYRGFTSRFDPMDVDERLERLGEALGLPAPTGIVEGMGG